MYILESVHFELLVIPHFQISHYTCSQISIANRIDVMTKCCLLNIKKCIYESCKNDEHYIFNKVLLKKYGFFKIFVGYGFPKKFIIAIQKCFVKKKRVQIASFHLHSQKYHNNWKCDGFSVPLRSQ